MNVRTRLKAFLFFTALAITCLEMQANNSYSSAVNSSVTITQQNTKKAQTKEKKRAEIAAYYGLTNSEVTEFLRMREDRDAKIRMIEKKQLSRKELQRQSRVVVDTYREQLKAFLTPEQYALFEAKLSKYRQTMARVKADKKSYQAERAKIYSLPQEQRRAAIEALNKKYVNKIAQYTNKYKAEQQILAYDYTQYALHKGGKKLKLSPSQRFKMAKILKQKEKRVKKLRDKKDLSRKERNKQIGLVRKRANQQLKQLIGNENFVKYTTYENKAHARKFKNKFGFTKQEYAKYIEIENALAIEKMIIRKTAIPKDEKKKRIEAAKNKKIESLRENLSTETFKKWYAAYKEKVKKSNNAV